MDNFNSDAFKVCVQRLRQDEKKVQKQNEGSSTSPPRSSPHTGGGWIEMEEGKGSGSKEAVKLYFCLIPVWSQLQGGFQFRTLPEKPHPGGCLVAFHLLPAFMNSSTASSHLLPNDHREGPNHIWNCRHTHWIDNELTARCTENSCLQERVQVRVKVQVRVWVTVNQSIGLLK